MRTPMKQIIESRCCLVTVLFAQIEDIKSLLLEAHKQGYAGEWIVPDSAYADVVVSYLRTQLDESSLNRLLRGMFQYVLYQIPHSKPQSLATVEY